MKLAEALEILATEKIDLTPRQKSAVERVVKCCSKQQYSACDGSLTDEQINDLFSKNTGGSIVQVRQRPPIVFDKEGHVVRQENITEDSFDEWMSERWNEYARAGLDDESSPNYDPHKAIEEFISDFQDRFPHGARIIKGKK